MVVVCIIQCRVHFFANPWTVASVHGILQARILDWVAISLRTEYTLHDRYCSEEFSVLNSFKAHNISEAGKLIPILKQGCSDTEGGNLPNP